MTSITPYTIAVPDAAIDRLRQKLALAQLPDELDGAGWDYGAPLADIKRLVNHWQTGYDWRRHEAELNKFPQFTTSVQINGFDPLQVHFVHQRSSRASAIPLLFVHGWPGSFIEVTKIISNLTAGSEDAPAFHVVAPSLPNYGFSEAPRKKGFAIPQYATTLHKLMLALGYSQYATQGGDWGYAITRCIGHLFPQHCRASHLNMAVPQQPQWKHHPLTRIRLLLSGGLTQREKAGLARFNWFRQEGFGYNLEQSTKPQTVGYSQTDSPVGLLAWIYEKLHDWTDGYPWTDDEVLTWISIYWFSRAGPAAPSRTYYEARHGHGATTFNASNWIPEVKLGVSYFPRELAPMPQLWHRTMGPLVFDNEHATGGHFAAWERPDAIVGDLRRMFGRGGGAFKAVHGISGFDNAPRAKL